MRRRSKKTLKELSHETGLSIDVVYYRKKRLISNGYFTYFVAQPGFGILHLDFSYIYIKTKKKTFPDISRMPLFAEIDKGVLLGFFSKDIMISIVQLTKYTTIIETTVIVQY